MEDYFFKLLTYFFEKIVKMTAQGELSSTQEVYITLSSIVVIFSTWKYKEVFSLFRNIRNLKIENNQHILKSYELKEEDKDFIRDEISRMIKYRLSGVSDIELQNLIFKLVAESDGLIPPSFFKKFKNFLKVSKGVLIFKRGVGYFFEGAIYYILSVVYLLIAVSFVFILAYNIDVLPLWKYLLIYIIAVVFSLISLSFFKMFPSSRERNLLIKILGRQDNASLPPSS